MYAALWRALPGRTWLKAAQALVLFAVVVLVCMQWVFPLIAPHMPFNDTTVTPTGSSGQ